MANDRVSAGLAAKPSADDEFLQYVLARQDRARREAAAARQSAWIWAIRAVLLLCGCVFLPVPMWAKVLLFLATTAAGLAAWMKWEKVIVGTIQSQTWPDKWPSEYKRPPR